MRWLRQFCDGAQSQKKNLDNLNQELGLDVHRVEVDVLLKRFKTKDIESGLTESQAKEN